MKIKSASQILIPLALSMVFFAKESSASVVSIQATDLGWYRSDGTHESYNINTLTGQLGGTEYRSFYIWEIPSYVGKVTSAHIEFNVEYSFGGSAIYYPVQGEMFDVSASTLPFIRQDNGAGQGEAVFNDLGSGTSFGQLSVLPGYDNYGYTMTVPLNADAINSINSSNGADFSLGMKNIGFNSGYDYFLFSSMSRDGSQILVLDIQSVPEPSSIFLLSIGLLGTCAFTRNRQNKVKKIQ